MGYNLLVNGVYWSCNPLTNHLLTSWDIQLEHSSNHPFMPQVGSGRLTTSHHLNRTPDIKPHNLAEYSHARHGRQIPCCQSPASHPFVAEESCPGNSILDELILPIQPTTLNSPGHKGLLWVIFMRRSRTFLLHLLGKAQKCVVQV